MADNKFLDRQGLETLWQQITILHARICRDNISNYNNDFIALENEICLVDTSDHKLRAKIGDGVTAWRYLPYADEYLLDEIDKVIIHGYYLNGKFYTDSTYTTEIPRSISRIYVDDNTKSVYHYDGTEYISINDTLPTANERVAGIMKLYQTGGQNTDGSMSQKAITNGVQSINFTLDETEDECLVLDLPWD